MGSFIFGMFYSSEETSHKSFQSLKGTGKGKDVARRGGRATDYWSSLRHIKSELQRSRDAEPLRRHQSEESRKGSYNARGLTHRQNEPNIG